MCVCVCVCVCVRIRRATDIDFAIKIFNVSQMQSCSRVPRLDVHGTVHGCGGWLGCVGGIGGDEGTCQESESARTRARVREREREREGGREGD